jgi:hypothetical protein
MNALTQSWREWRERGFYGLALRLSASARLPHSLFLLTETDILQLKRLNHRALERRPVGYEWSSAGPELTDGLLRCSPAQDRETLRHVFERFFVEGASCYVACHKREVAAYVWAFPSQYVLTYDGYRKRNLTIRLDDGSLFLGNGMIDEKHRLRGLFPHLMGFVMTQWPSGTRLYSAIDSNNVHSLRSHCRLGFEPCQKVLCLTLFGVTRYFKSTLPKSSWKLQRADSELLLPPTSSLVEAGCGRQ